MAGFRQQADNVPAVGRLHDVEIRLCRVPQAEAIVMLGGQDDIFHSGRLGNVEPGAVVVSQSCVALRIAPSHRDKVSAEFLLMYLRSEAGQAQLESLQAGATVQHVSPQSLLTSFLVPMPTAEERVAVEADYRHLCQLEQDIERIQQQMTEIAKSRWAL